MTDAKPSYDELLARVAELEQDSFFQAFKTSLHVATISRLEDGAYLEVNDAFTSVTGFTRDEALAGSTVGLKLWVNEEDRRRLVADLRAGRAITDRECLFRTRSGKVITGLVSAQVIQLSEGPCILSSIADITERKLTEMRLTQARAEAQRLREALDHLSTYVYMKDREGRYVYANRPSICSVVPPRSWSAATTAGSSRRTRCGASGR